MTEIYEIQDWQQRLPAEQEAAMRAQGRVYRKPEGPLDDPYVLDQNAFVVARDHNKEVNARLNREAEARNAVRDALGPDQAASTA